MRCYYLKGVTVEPVAFLALFSLCLIDQISQQYIHKKLKVKSEPKHQNVSTNTTNFTTCNKSDTLSWYFPNMHDIKSEAGLWLLCLDFAVTIPAIFTTLILGKWSDKTGRKVVLVLPSCGGLIQVSVYLLAINLDLSINVLLIGNIIYGFSGYVTLTIAICMAYIADTTSKQDRTLCIVILSTVIGLGSGLAKFISSYWIHADGLLVPLWLIFGCSIANILYIIILIPETIIRDYRRIPAKLCLLLVCRLFSNNVCRSIWCRLVTMYLISFFIVELVLSGYHMLVFTYAISWPLCFEEAYIHYLSGAVTCTFLTSLIVVKLFQFIPWFSNHWIIEFGLLSAAGGLVLAAFAKTTFVMFMVPVASMFAMIPLAVLRACMSKIVDFHQQGFLFAMVGCVESIGCFTGYLAFYALYHSTQHIKSGMAFLLGAGMLAIPGILIGITQFYQGYRSYNVFVESITSQAEDSTSESEENEPIVNIGRDPLSGNSNYQTFS